MTDEQVTGWALAAGRGDRDAAAAFVRATQRQLRRFLQHLAGPEELDDLTQETYLRALRSLPGFAGRSSARTWLYTIARRVAVDHVRAAVVRPRIAPVGIRPVVLFRTTAVRLGTFATPPSVMFPPPT
ncbi:sigma factor, partial [Actinoplanes sp. NPDC048791]|uniref:sigma factor n=1 Tax=Actinoplanes sp. NPDC048791 TaxID=3154623 RepID=UPI0033E5F336